MDNTTSNPEPLKSGHSLVKKIKISWFCNCNALFKKPRLVSPVSESREQDKSKSYPIVEQPSKHLYEEDVANYYCEALTLYKRNVGEDLSVTLRVPLLLGAFVGLIPIQGIRQNGNQSFSWLHYRTLISTAVVGVLLMNTVFIAHNFILKVASGKNHAGEMILTFSGVWFYSAGTLVYIFFLLRSKRLCEYFKFWTETSIAVSSCMIPERRVRKDVKLITTFVLLDCLGENILYHFHAMKLEQREKMSALSFSDFLRDYYDSNQYIFPFFSYNAIVSLALLVTNKLATYAWNFGDIILILISRALYGRYLCLNTFLEQQYEPHGCILLIKKGSVSWRSIRKNFLRLTELLEEANGIFSPLVWLSYTTDIFFVCRQLYEGLASKSTAGKAVDKIYMVWSLIHLIVRTLGVNLMAAKINEEAHRMSKVLQHCHPDEYDEEVRRLERFLGSRMIGITGSGCFIITKSFVFMIISAIFTLEVVLLQNGHLTLG
ncbi:unnamed protein product [Orchesella dallaii]|uniref:Gustatory receptor n=1 Tax=Orchesella dallaii TaxID=48710 RepID=A0ABP1R9G6_9HEXA